MAIVALARKVLCTLHHLLTNKEPYMEDKKREKKKMPNLKPLDKTSIDEMIDLLAKAGYLVVPGRWYNGT